MLSEKAFSPTWQMGVKGYNWWETELPNNQEVLLNLKAHNFKIDYILTHTYPKSTVIMKKNKQDDGLFIF